MVTRPENWSSFEHVKEAITVLSHIPPASLSLPERLEIAKIHAILAVAKAIQESTPDTRN